MQNLNDVLQNENALATNGFDRVGKELSLKLPFLCIAYSQIAEYRNQCLITGKGPDFEANWGVRHCRFGDPEIVFIEIHIDAQRPACLEEVLKKGHGHAILLELTHTQAVRAERASSKNSISRYYFGNATLERMWTNT